MPRSSKSPEVKERKWRIISSGPVRTIVELEYDGWNASGEASIFARESPMGRANGVYSRDFCEVRADDFEFATGLPAKAGIEPLTSNNDSPAEWLADMGEQVVAPGPTATEAVPGQQLGLAILTLAPHAAFANDGKNT